MQSAIPCVYISAILFSGLFVVHAIAFPAHGVDGLGQSVPAAAAISGILDRQLDLAILDCLLQDAGVVGDSLLRRS